VTTSCVVTIGETMAMFRATSLGGIDLVSDFRLGIGGAESNVAIGLARLGAPVTWLGRVGEDSLGRRITRELMAEGGDARAIVDGLGAERAYLTMWVDQPPLHVHLVVYPRWPADEKRGWDLDVERWAGGSPPADEAAAASERLRDYLRQP